MPDDPPAIQQNHNINYNFTAKAPEEIRLGNFDSDKSKIWDDWIEQYEWYKVASDLQLLAGEKQVAILMNSLERKYETSIKVSI